MKKKRFIESLVEKTKELKQSIGKRVVPLVLAGGIAVGSVFGLASCDDKKVELTQDNKLENVQIDELKDLVESLQDEVNDLKLEVNTKADLKTVSEISKELTSIANTLADLTKNIANINDYYLSVSKKVEDMQQGMDKLAEMYNKQDEDLTMLINKLANLEAKVQTLSNSNNNTNNSTNNNTSTNDLQAQIAEMQQTINRLALENAIQNTIHCRYNKVVINQDDNYGTEYIAPNGNLCAYLEVDEKSIYYISEDNFGCMLNTTTGENNIDCGDESSNAFVHFNSIILGMQGLENCTITKENDRYTISINEDGVISTTYVTLDKHGYIKTIQFDDGLFYNVEGTSRNEYQMMRNICKEAQKTYNDLKSIIDNSWKDDCLVYSPHTEKEDEYGVYFNSEEAYLYMNEAEYGTTYGVANNDYTLSITKTTDGEVELYSQPSQNIMQLFKDIILDNGEDMLISYDAKTNTYIIEDEYNIKVKYVVENNEIVSIKVLDKENNIEKECVRTISQSEFEQKSNEIKTKFEELKDEYDNTNTLGK